MFVHYRTQGIILRKQDRGESNRLLTFYTKDFGKLEILGKAIRKISSKLRTGTEIFYLSEIEFIQGKRYKILTDTTPVERFEKLRKDLVKTKMAHRIAEIFDGLVSGQEKDKRTWDLISSFFTRLNDLNFKISDIKLQYYYFVWNLLSLLGYLPELYHCALCGEKLQPAKLYFSSLEGGIICEHCFPKLKQTKLISVNTVKTLRVLTEKGHEFLKKIKISPADLKELHIITDHFLENHLVQK